MQMFRPASLRTESAARAIRGRRCRRRRRTRPVQRSLWMPISIFDPKRSLSPRFLALGDFATYSTFAKCRMECLKQNRVAEWFEQNSYGSRRQRSRADRVVVLSGNDENRNFLFTTL